jgi:hypothetical protein
MRPYLEKRPITKKKKKKKKNGGSRYYQGIGSCIQASVPKKKKKKGKRVSIFLLPENSDGRKN